MNDHLINLDRLLQFHDWSHEFSDDHSQYIRGRDERDAINKEQRRLISAGVVSTEEIVELTDKYRPKNS